MAERNLTGVVLAAGSGTRLQPLTFLRPKPLLPVAGQTLLDYNLDKLAAAGASEAMIVIPGGDRAIPRAVGTRRFGMRIRCLPQPQPKGTGHALSLVKSLVSSTFFVIFSDNVTPWEVGRLLDRHRRTGAFATLALFHAEDPRRHGIAEVAGGRIVRLVEKPARPATDLASAGMFVLEPVIFDALCRLTESHGETHIVDAVQYLIDHGHKASYRVLNVWRRNVNRPEDLLESNRRLLASMTAAVRQKAARGPGCRIGPGASIGRDVAMGARCRIGGGAVIRNTIMLAGVSVGRGCDIRDCVFGEGAQVADGVALRRLVMGDGERAAESRAGGLFSG